METWRSWKMCQAFRQQAQIISRCLVRRATAKTLGILGDKKYHLIVVHVSISHHQGHFTPLAIQAPPLFYQLLFSFTHSHWPLCTRRPCEMLDFDSDSALPNRPFSRGKSLGVPIRTLPSAVSGLRTGERNRSTCESATNHSKIHMLRPMI